MGFSRLDDGTYIDVNDTFVSVTGYSRQEAIGSRSVNIGIVSLEDWERMRKELQAKGCMEDFELSLYTKNGSRLICRMWGEIISIQGQDHLLVMASDITEQHTIQSERMVTLDLLQLINKKSDLKELIQGATLLFANASGCEAVGIRLQEGDDFPYFETRGFPRAFVKAENFLCTKDSLGEVVRDDVGNPVLECMCGNILCGRFDPALPFFTETGSFWSNCTTELLASTSEEDRQARTRNRCNGEGYESVALIPLRYMDKTFGLVQLNDKRKNRFAKETVYLYERLAGHLALALKERSDAADLFKEKTLMAAVLGLTPDFNITDSKRTELLLRARLRLSEFASTHSLDELLKKSLAEAE